MAISTLLLSLCLAQDPAPAAPMRLDVVELKGGEILEGRIVLELGNYLEIELGPGAVVGFRTTEVAAVRRGAGPPAVAAAPAGLQPRDDWFTLHDGAGRAVGWLHATITRAGDGTARLQEEWEFSEERRHFQVTMLETTDAEGQPATCYFRERVSEEMLGHAPQDPGARSTRLREERIVEARIAGEVLEVQRLTGEGRTARELPWSRESTFPLLARARQRECAAAARVPVFDPAIEELATRTFAAQRQRTVAIDGQPVEVQEVVEQGPGADNAVWLDAAARIVRREIAGPALVAVPCTAERARAAVSRGSAVPAAFVADASQRFGLWRPNPAWDVLPTADGSICLACTAHDAKISVAIMDHLDTGTSLPAAADAVQRWFKLLRPELLLDRRDWTKVRGRDAIVLDTRGRVGRSTVRATLHVVPAPDGFLVLVCEAAGGAWDELQHDFDGVVQQLELEPGAVAPLVQPEPAAGGRPAGTTGAPAPAGTPAPAMPLVRVPTGAPQAGGR
jgi:hypothetical protein